MASSLTDSNTAESTENPSLVGQLNATPESKEEQKLPVGIYKEILFKRKDISTMELDAGHWWIEIYSDAQGYAPANLMESYGWYPFVDANADGLPDVTGQLDAQGRIEYVKPGAWAGFKGVPGRVNRNLPLDPHGDPQTPGGVDWNLDTLYYATVKDGRSLKDVATCIREFATHHQAEWAYPAYDGEDHCQTFQEKIIAHCRIFIKQMTLGTFEDVPEEPAEDPLELLGRD